MPRKLNDCGKSLLAVLSHPQATPHGPLTDRERVLLMRWCGSDRDPLIFEAINLFNATIVANRTAADEARANAKNSFGLGH